MKAEPAVVGSILAAIINVVVLLLLKHDLSTDWKAAIVGLVTAVRGLWVRQRVTPVG